MSGVKLATKIEPHSPQWLLNRALKVRKNLPLAIKQAAVNLRNRLRIEIRSHAKEPTGALENSWALDVRGPLEISVQTASPYARIRDRGGIIKPRRGQFLAIPLRRTWRGRSPRDFSGPGFGFVGRGDRRYFGRFSQGTSGKRRFTPMFALRRQVKQDGWHYVEKARERWLKQIKNRGVIDLIGLERGE